MGFRFRKTKSFGPARMSLGKRGAGFSFGFPGFRIGISPDGRVYISLGFPGTGFSYIKYFGSAKG